MRRYLGFIILLAALPLAVAAERTRDRADELIRAENGPITVVLPDSSRVMLEQGSSLRMPRDFARERRLWIVGAALLHIPFGPATSVWTETAFLTTTGGRFEIRASGLERTHVSVTEGRVVLRAMNEDNDPAYPRITLEAGQRGFSTKMVGAKRLP